MKLLITADIHGSRSALKLIAEKAKKEDVDLIISAGDLSVFEREIESVIESLDKIGVPVLVVPGNHESPEDLKKLSQEYENIIYLHKATYQFGDFVFVGYGNPGFALKEPEMEQFFGKIKKAISGKRVILITHGPPYSTKLDYLNGEHVGCKTITDFIKENNNILFAISGHIHENFSVKDKIGKTKLINPGPRGEIMVI